MFPGSARARPVISPHPAVLPTPALLITLVIARRVDTPQDTVEMAPKVLIIGVGQSQLACIFDAEVDIVLQERSTGLRRSCRTIWGPSQTSSFVSISELFSFISHHIRVQHMESKSREELFRDLSPGQKYGDVVAIFHEHLAQRIVGHPDAEMINALPPSCKWIAHKGAGYDQFDVAACKARGEEIFRPSVYLCANQSVSQESLFQIPLVQWTRPRRRPQSIFSSPPSATSPCLSNIYARAILLLRHTWSDILVISLALRLVFSAWVALVSVSWT
jgi:hypothetical protein